ncbi:hypothetical protein [Fibrobacter succinogenes]|jgi:hypothetical protein|uniref:hypothetical protein n=1 Tax=Fibrobacter succinogenes TaxID=833 RepID=UPI0002D83800|nr:hypothetical protein [Fibrobacter succinogenes]
MMVKVFAAVTRFLVAAWNAAPIIMKTTSELQIQRKSKVIAWKIYQSGFETNGKP